MVIGVNSRLGRDCTRVKYSLKRGPQIKTVIISTVVNKDLADISNITGDSQL